MASDQSRDLSRGIRPDIRVFGLEGGTDHEALIADPLWRKASQETYFLSAVEVTFSIADRIPRKRQRLPSSLVIENADFGNAIGFGFEAFPMNANDYSSTGPPTIVSSVVTQHAVPLWDPLSSLDGPGSSWR